jgi:hypothetical protein
MLGSIVLRRCRVRKVLIDSENGKPKDQEESWLDLERVAAVELSSEDPDFPIEHALAAAPTTGWRASAPGPQRIRLLFDTPHNFHRIQLHFVEKDVERAQELWLLAFADGELRDVARQQWNFSPGGSTEEMEDYRVSLKGVTALELRIDPDRSHDPQQSRHRATLQHLRLA